MLYLIGLGLGDEKDITVKGLEAIRSCSHVFLEHYTSILGVNTEKLEEFYGVKITIADRTMVESEADIILDASLNNNCAFLVVGDPFGATTHSDLVLRAKEKGILVKVIHNASIMNAVGCTGLQLYRFGETISLCFFTDTWKPSSFYDKLKVNAKHELHTLCLLDIKVKEPDFDAMMKGKTKFLPPRYMTVNTACEQLIYVEEEDKKENVYTKDSIAVGVARVGRDDQQIISGTLQELCSVDFGEPLHSLILCGSLHDLEKDMIKQFLIPGSKGFEILK